jgi:AraC-like DNA-binding protein
MEAAGVGEGDLRDPDARVPVAAEIAVWQALAQYISEPGFGVTAGAASRLRQFGLLGYIASFSATLRHALRRVERYGRVLTEAVEFKLQEGRPDVGFAIGHPALGPGLPFAQGFRLAAVLQASRELTGIDIVPREVAFTCRRPSSILAHRRHFRCPLQFGAPAARLVFAGRDLDVPVVRADETLAGYLSKYADQVLASLLRGEAMRHTVRAAIWSQLGDGKPSLESVAAALRVPRRTLQRRLAAEDTSLHREMEGIRKSMAMALLRDRSCSIDDVAFLLGYAEPSSFFRSFRRWTGTTPHHFRSRAA